MTDLSRKVEGHKKKSVAEEKNNGDHGFRIRISSAVILFLRTRQEKRPKTAVNTLWSLQ